MFPKIPHNKIMTEKDERMIIDLYNQGLSGRQILNIIGKFKQNKSIFDVLKKHKVKGRNKQDYIILNHNYFEKIDSSAKAYFLGLMITDGWIHSKRNQVGIQLQIGDIDIIKVFKNELATPNKIVLCHKRRENEYHCHSEMVRLLVVSKKMIKDLKKYGVVDKKTFKVFFPKIPNKYYSSLLRGILDGDGCIHTRKKVNNTCIYFCGNKKLMIGIRDFLVKNLNVSFKKVKSHSSIYIVRWGKQEDVKNICKYLYKDKGLFYLKRKYEKIKSLIN